MGAPPTLAASLAFVAGVAAGAWLPQQPGPWGWAALAALGAWAALLAAGRAGAASRAGMAAFAVVGVFRCQADLAPLYSGEAGPEEGDAVAAGRVGRPVEARDGGAFLHLDDVLLRRGGETFRLSLPLQVVVEGATAIDLAPGDRIVARGGVRRIRGDRNLGWFPGPVAPLGRRYAARLSVPSAAWVRRAGRTPGAGAAAAVLRWRASADAFWKQRPGAAGAVLNALTTGERAGLPAGAEEDFLRSGLTHLLAISGMNVGFLAALVFLALRGAFALCEPLALRVPAQPLAALCTLPALWFFLLFSGSQLPVARAALMSGTALAALALWRRIPAAAACGLAAAGIVARDPRALFTASFQLSFAAVAALLLAASRLAARGTDRPRGWWPRLRASARSLLAVSLAASGATAPLVAFHFQQVSVVGPLANLVAVPFAGFVVLPAAWATLAARACSPAAGAVLGDAAAAAADALVGIASWFASPAWAVLRTARPPALATAGLLALAATLVPKGSGRVACARAFACAAAALACTGWTLGTHRPGLVVAVLDVGQGLSAAVVGPGGASLLFDAGPRWGDYDAGERVVAPALRRLGLWRLETLAVSHAHPDHAGGAASVRRMLSNDGLVRGPVPFAAAPNAERRFGAGASVRCLNAAATVVGSGEARDANDRSLALLVAYGETGVVLTGDAGHRVVAGIAEAARPHPPHLLLQAPHHGGSPEACRVLAERLRPELVAVPVGRNTYGHPRPGAVAAFEPDARVMRTDLEGAVLACSDGRVLSARTWRELARGRTWPERLRWLVAGW